MDYEAHWSQLYQTKDSTQVSWYQKYPALSLDLIEHTGLGPDAAIIDVGAGASVLADHLLAQGYRHLTLLDLAAEALQVTRDRLGPQAQSVTWIVGDITTIPLPSHHYDIWHDRAVFHFLTDPILQEKYVQQVRHALKPGGHLIIATFAPDGPERCSGLTVARYDADTLQAVLGHVFELQESRRETHQTPFGTEQHFVYARFQFQG